MFKSLHHAELGGGYTMRRKIIINAADLRAYGDGIEVCAMTADGDELDTVNASTEAAAIRLFIWVSSVSPLWRRSHFTA